ncbi:glycosyltransferase family 4 protein [Hyphomicrobium denitrificans]|nr:glycosyltransferase family 4 protein [Hyphomicrobium denitrificans]
MHTPLPKFAPTPRTKVAYVINQYPKVSHSFIRREIQALEEHDIAISRYAIRGWVDKTLVDPADREEQSRTIYILQQPILKLAVALLSAVVQNPRSFLAATGRAFSAMRRSKGRRLVHLAYLVEAAVIADWALKAGVEHIHAHFGTNSAEVAMLAHELTGLPYSFTVHGPEEFDRPVELGLPEKVKAASFVCAISSYGRSQLWRWLPYREWSKIKLVHCGLDAQFLAIAPTPATSKNRLVCIGRLCEQKGQLLLVDAVGRLASEGSDVEVVLAGDGEMRADIEKRIAKLNLADRISITGWIDSDRIIREIKQARALVLPSFAEGIPVVLMEAMALERPVISTYVAGIPELVKDRVSGWLTPAGDVNALTEAIKECLEASDDVLAMMGGNARQAALKDHNIATECEKLANLFQSSARRTRATID